MTDKLDGKAALVTGASSGNGRAIALRFAEEGASITVADIQEAPRQGGEPTHELIETEGGTAQFVKTDVSNPEDIQTAVERTVNAYGSLDIMVNNAGIFPGLQPVDEVDEDDYDGLMDVNLKGVLFGSKFAAEVMRDQDDGGAIVNMSSIAGLNGFDDSPLYCASKGGVANLTRELAMELGPDGIRVNAINPGVIETAMTTEDEEVAGTMVEEIPLRRDGEPEDVAGVALFLASDDAAYVSGHNLVVDGGLTAG
jgi:NAD(P)-dependent dehydrogenase (short-subunit alcohol dehydrogenase family)